MDQDPVGHYILKSWRVQRFCLVPQPLDAVVKDRRRLTSHTPESPQRWGWKEKENQGSGFTSSEAPESTQEDQKPPKIF